MSGARAGYARLEDQIDWYDSKSISHQIWYRRLKVISTASAALVPLFGSKTADPLSQATPGPARDAHP